MGGHDAVSPDASHLRGDEDSSNSFSIPKNLSQEPIRTQHLTTTTPKQLDSDNQILSLFAQRENGLFDNGVPSRDLPGVDSGTVSLPAIST